MKVLSSLALLGGLLIIVAVPSYLFINFYHQRMGRHYHLPRFKLVAVSLILALLVSGLMEVNFEGSVFTGLATLFMLYCALFLLGVGGFTIKRYFSKSV